MHIYDNIVKTISGYLGYGHGLWKITKVSLHEWKAVRYGIKEVIITRRTLKEISTAIKEPINDITTFTDRPKRPLGRPRLHKQREQRAARKW